MNIKPLYLVSLKWGGIYAGISTLSFVGMYAFGAGANKTVALIVGVLSLIINVLILVMSNRDYRNTYLGGYIRYGQCLSNSILVMLMSMVVVSLLSFLLYQVIDPEAFEKIVSDQLLLLDQNDKIPASYKQAQIDSLVNMTPLKYVGFQLIGGAIWGVIIAFIVSAFTRKKNNTFDGVIKEIE